MSDRPDATGPNLFVVGAAKSGTTSLWAYLATHPDVFMSRVKEPHFFSRGGKHSGQGAVKEPAAYARLFARGAQHVYRGEASPSYLWDTETAPRIKQAVPDARIIVSLRDPVERAWSGYLMSIRMGHEQRSFAQAVKDELAQDHVDPAARPWPHVSRGYYADQLRPYLDAFTDATIVLLFEEFVADVRGTMRTVFERLGLDPRPAEAIDPAPVFPFQSPRNAASALALRVPGARRVGEAVFRGAVRARVQGAVYRYEKPALLDAELRRRLREIYAPHDERLRRLLGRTLPWDGLE